MEQQQSPDDQKCNNEASELKRKGKQPAVEEPFFKSYPPGYRFQPYDEELITHYLIPKIEGREFPQNLILEENIYMYNPETLIKEIVENEKAPDEGEWYFFTKRDKKYKNGRRPNRQAGDGFWKATGADKLIEGVDRNVIGRRKTLKYLIGLPPKGITTDWKMHEYFVTGSSISQKMERDDLSTDEDTCMRLDDCVLCKIYKTDKGWGRKPQGAADDKQENTPLPSEEEIIQLEDEVIEEDGDKTFKKDGLLCNNEEPSTSYSHYSNIGYDDYDQFVYNYNTNVNNYVNILPDHFSYHYPNGGDLKPEYVYPSSSFPQFPQTYHSGYNAYTSDFRLNYNSSCSSASTSNAQISNEVLHYPPITSYMNLLTSPYPSTLQMIKSTNYYAPDSLLAGATTPPVPATYVDANQASSSRANENAAVDLDPDNFMMFP